MALDTSTKPIRFDVTRADSVNPSRESILLNPGFGKSFSDHMVTIRWTADGGWQNGRLSPYAPIAMDPSSAVLHYGQAIFEGFKAYLHEDGAVYSFRPDANGRRMQRSAARLALPQLPVETFVAAADLLIATDRDWVPIGGERSYYVRPLMFGAESFLGVRPSREVLFVVIGSPAGDYFAGGVHPVSIWVSEDYVRASAGGTGAAKCGGNYAASLVAQQEAATEGCEQVVFLDAAEHRWVEELGGMNVFMVRRDGTLITPELSGTILEGITRESLIALARDSGRSVEERRIGIDEWRQGIASGEITESFACGTAAVVTPIGRLRWRGGETVIADGDTTGPVTAELRAGLLDLQYGRRPDPHGWLHRVG